MVAIEHSKLKLGDDRKQRGGNGTPHEECIRNMCSTLSPMENGESNHRSTARFFKSHFVLANTNAKFTENKPSNIEPSTICGHHKPGVSAP